MIRHGASFEVLATNTLDDGFDASAALVDDHIYLRGYRNLYDSRPAVACPAREFQRHRRWRPDQVAMTH